MTSNSEIPSLSQNGMIVGQSSASHLFHRLPAGGWQISPRSVQRKIQTEESDACIRYFRVDAPSMG